MTNQAENYVVLLQKIINLSYILVHTASPRIVLCMIYCSWKCKSPWLKPQNSQKTEEYIISMMKILSSGIQNHTRVRITVTLWEDAKYEDLLYVVVTSNIAELPLLVKNYEGSSKDEWWVGETKVHSWLWNFGKYVCMRIEKGCEKENKLLRKA